MAETCDSGRNPIARRSPGRFDAASAPTVTSAAARREILVALLVAVVLPLVVSKADAGLDLSRRPVGRYCGVYSVYGALRAARVHHSASIESLLHPRYVGGRTGSSPAELSQAVEDCGGHACISTDLSSDALRSSPYPLILHVAADGQLPRYEHWTLFLGMEGSRARVLDAPHPPELLPVAELLRNWDGVGIVVSAERIDMSPLASPGRGSLLGIGIGSALCLAVGNGIRRGGRRGRGQRPAPVIRLRRHVAQACVLLVVGSVCGFTAHAASDEGFLANPRSTSHLASAYFPRQFPTFAAQEMEDAVIAREVIIVDARSDSQYDRGHIANAVNVPIDATPSARRSVTDKIIRSARLVVYCQSERCSIHQQVASWLASEGFTNVCLYSGGWDEWSQRDSHRRQEFVQLPRREP